MAGKHSDHYFRRWQANIVTTSSMKDNFKMGKSMGRGFWLKVGISLGDSCIDSIYVGSYIKLSGWIH
jgi:hypothetical protein